MNDNKLKTVIEKIIYTHKLDCDNDLLVNEIVYEVDVFFNDTCNSEEIKDVVEIYHKILPELPKVIKITDIRRKKIRKLFKNDIPTFEAWEEYFKKVAQSDFLMGKTTKWKADFEWLINSTNALKVAEGRYTENVPKTENEYDWMVDLK